MAKIYKASVMSVYDENGNKIPIPALKGKDGEKGDAVTIQDISENTTDGGNNVVTFSDGKTLTIKNGSKGPKGDIPVKGTDYWTEEDKQEIQTIIDADIADLEDLLRSMLYAIQNGGSATSIVAEIEQLLVSYLENIPVEEVEA